MIPTLPLVKKLLQARLLFSFVYFISKSGAMVDQATKDKLEAGFQKLQAATDCKSLLKKYLTKEVFDACKDKKTALGATLLDCIQSGVENLDSGVGIYAPDAEAYTLFAPIFNPIIEDYHEGFKPTDKHPPTDFGDINTLVNVDPTGEYVVSTRVRCGRSLKGYAFNPCLTEAAVNIIESKLPFSRDDRLGYLTFCPTNLGTTIRASVHIALPKLAKDKKVLEDIAAKFNLQVRGTRGEHTESEGGVYDISNKRRMGLTEYQAVKEMQDGILEMIKMEKAAA
ncbi:arginine kinase [Parasteatoda tepidariorum]|uniref:arginine kinase n=1 Tax=Parasteatoda tepidariorum TaxID=114398 RepID=UPI0039BD7C04